MKKYIIPIFRAITLPIFAAFIIIVIFIVYVKWLWNFEFSKKSIDILNAAKKITFKSWIDYVLCK